MIEEKRNAARDVLDIAYEVIVAFEKKAARGDITGAQAQQEALSVISHLRYRDKDYFWVNDLEPKMLMHPIFPSLNGKNLSHDKDPTGKLLFMEMVTLVQQQDEGFVEYLWPRPGTTEPVPKLSYVKLFKPWAWIIGSGIYIDDVKAELTRINGMWSPPPLSVSLCPDRRLFLRPQDFGTLEVALSRTDFGLSPFPDIDVHPARVKNAFSD